MAKSHRSITTNKESSRPTFSKPFWKKYILMKKEQRNSSNHITKQIIIIIPENIFHENKQLTKNHQDQHFSNTFRKIIFLKKIIQHHNKTNYFFRIPENSFHEKKITNKDSSRSIFSKHVKKKLFP